MFLHSGKTVGDVLFRDEKYRYLIYTWLIVSIHVIQCLQQRCGSGSVIICHYLIWISIRILPSISKKSKKNLYLYYFFTSFWPFISEDWCKCTFKSNKQKSSEKKLFVLVFCQPLTKKAGSGSVIGDTNPRIRICTMQYFKDPQYHWFTVLHAN